MFRTLILSCLDLTGLTASARRNAEGWESLELILEKRSRHFRRSRNHDVASTLPHSKYDLFVRHPCTSGAPKSNNDLNTERAGMIVRFRVIFGRARGAVSRPRNFINTLKILRHRRASRVRDCLPAVPRASSAPAVK